MSELNLPEEFRAIEDWLCECEGMTKLAYHDKTNSAITIADARKLFTALSEARDELHRLNCIVGDLVSDKKSLRGENSEKNKRIIELESAIEFAKTEIDGLNTYINGCPICSEHLRLKAKARKG